MSFRDDVLLEPPFKEKIMMPTQESTDFKVARVYTERQRDVYREGQEVNH